MIKRIAKIILYDKKNDKFLLQLRDSNPAIAYPNTWTLFGGKIEGKESPEEAVKREIAEELVGLRVMKIKKLFTNNRNQDGIEVEDNILYGEVNSDISNVNLLEGQKMKLFSKKELDSYNVFPLFKKYIKDFINKEQ